MEDLEDVFCTINKEQWDRIFFLTNVDGFGPFKGAKTQCWMFQHQVQNVSQEVCSLNSTELSPISQALCDRLGSTMIGCSRR
jgi:hypothetical protein